MPPLHLEQPATNTACNKKIDGFKSYNTTAKIHLQLQKYGRLETGSFQPFWGQRPNSSLLPPFSPLCLMRCRWYTHSCSAQGAVGSGLGVLCLNAKMMHHSQGGPRKADTRQCVLVMAMVVMMRRRMRTIMVIMIVKNYEWWTWSCKWPSRPSSASTTIAWVIFDEGQCCVRLLTASGHPALFVAVALSAAWLMLWRASVANTENPSSRKNCNHFLFLGNGQNAGLQELPKPLWTKINEDLHWIIIISLNI